MTRTAVIIGAGPAGLTAAYELLDRTDIRVVVLEQDDCVGGLSRTINHNGNRMDIGGHRFFSKSDRVMHWWLGMMPIGPRYATSLAEDRLMLPEAGDPLQLLERQRISRIYYLRQFFDYPIKLDANTLRGLGAYRVVRMAASYAGARLLPRREERSLEDFMINRFGAELYQTFFRDYTEKVWGVPCSTIGPEWGAQRIKGLSVSSAIAHAIRSALRGLRKRTVGIEQKNVETSLIERFLYPKYGPGQLWEEVRRRVQARGGRVYLKHRVTGLDRRAGEVCEVIALDRATGERRGFRADYVVSTMPVCDLMEALGEVPENVRRIASGLQFRDFITAGLLVPQLEIKNTTRIETRNELIPDNWIYIQEARVKLGRLQVFQNWSPYMVANLDQVWLGLEYFCQQGDSMWTLTDSDFLSMSARELESIGIVNADRVLDGIAIRVEKAYPAYFGTYDRFSIVRDYTDTISNLFLVGRNGMHRYNNADHSMLTAMTAVDNIVSGRRDKGNLWDINTELDYQEE